MNTYQITYENCKLEIAIIYADNEQDARNSFMRRYPSCAIVNILNLSEDEDF